MDLSAAQLQAIADMVLPRLERLAAASVEVALSRQPQWQLMPGVIDPDSQRGAVCNVEPDDTPGETVEAVRTDPRQGVPDAGEGSRTRTLLLRVPGAAGFCLGIIPDDTDDAELSPPTIPWPAMVHDHEAGSYSFTITSHGVATTAGSYAPCGVAFLAPPSGTSLIALAGVIGNSGANATGIAPVVREGDVVGSGTVVLAGSAENEITNTGTNDIRPGVVVPAEGLTPGEPYNVQLEHRVSGGTGNASRREVVVWPDLGVALP